jgi:adenylate cyclase
MPGMADLDPLPSDSAQGISAEELAVRLGIARERVERLADLGVLVRDGDGRFAPGDVHRVRLLDGFEDAGVPLEALIAASQAGAISLRYYDELHPPPEELSGRTYGAFAASLGPGAAHLTRLFAAFGLAEPEPGASLSAPDEALIADFIDIIVATGQPDLALRAVRMFGEGARRAADAALGIYGEAVDRSGGDFRGLPIDDVFERLLRPWARFARRSSDLAAWLASHHHTPAIDEDSVTESERILEDGGFVATRLDAPPAVAFVDLTGFTRLTEERGDEIAAGMAMRLGEVSGEVVAGHGGRVVKLLGDGVLVRFADAASALAGTLDLLEALPAAGLPTGHAGVAAGTLIVREGDVFGRTVNLAARISDVTPDGHVYVPAGLAEELPAGTYETRSVEAALLQGIGRVALLDVTRSVSGR